MGSHDLSVKVLIRSGGKSAPAAAAYFSRTILSDHHQGVDFDYSAMNDLAFSMIMAPDNAPAWASDRSALWNAVEAAEQRKDAMIAREIEIALPIELTLEQNIELLKLFTKKSFVNHGMIADVNIHANENQFHAHIMITTKDITSDGFGKINRECHKTENVLKWRESWLNAQNIHLRKAWVDNQVDQRSFADNKLTAEPLDR